MKTRKGLWTFLLIFSAVILMVGCSRKGEEKEVFQWDLGSGVSASFEDDGNYGYVLKVQGTGAVPNYQNAESTPWYNRSGRVSEIVVGEGIVSIGDNAFSEVTHVEEVLLPQSLASIGHNAFRGGVVLYAQGPVENRSQALCCTYSGTQTVAEGTWWHYVEGKPQVWETPRVLFIGNSFTYYNDIDLLFQKVAAGAGIVVETDRIAIGAHNLTQFGDPLDEGGKVVEEYLTGRDYTAVVLQEQSTRPITGYTFFHDAVLALNQRISQTQDNAKVYLYSTWGFPKSQGSMTIPEMEGKIRDAYALVASEISAGISPVGEAFTRVYLEHREINLIHTDDQHPSYAGSFLSACVHAAAILGLDPRSSTFDGQLSPEVAGLLKEVAYETVFNKNK